MELTPCAILYLEVKIVTSACIFNKDAVNLLLLGKGVNKAQDDVLKWLREIGMTRQK